MVDPEEVLYHFGWIIGVGWMALALGQILVGLEGRATMGFAGWETYAWMGAVQFLLGVAYLVWWFVTFRNGRIREDGIA